MVIVTIPAVEAGPLDSDNKSFCQPSALAPSDDLGAARRIAGAGHPTNPEAGQ